MPPRWMWTLPEELDEHFAKVKADRGSGNSDPDEPPGPTIKNEYAENRGRNVR